MAWASLLAEGQPVGRRSASLTFLGDAGPCIKYQYSHKIHEGARLGQALSLRPGKHAHGGDLHAPGTRRAASMRCRPADRTRPATHACSGTPAHSADEPVESHPATPPAAAGQLATSSPGEKLEPSNVATAPVAHPAWRRPQPGTPRWRAAVQRPYLLYGLLRDDRPPQHSRAGGNGGDRVAVRAQRPFRPDYEPVDSATQPASG